MAQKPGDKKVNGKGRKNKTKSFPDLSGDGKVTQKDILMGRGVIKRSRGGSTMPGMKKRVMKRGGGMANKRVKAMGGGAMKKRAKAMGGGAMKKRVMKRGGGMMKKPMMKRGGMAKKK